MDDREGLEAQAAQARVVGDRRRQAAGHHRAAGGELAVDARRRGGGPHLVGRAAPAAAGEQRRGEPGQGAPQRDGEGRGLDRHGGRQAWQREGR